MLRRDYDCVNSYDLIVVIFNGNLSFTVGSEICEIAVLPLLCQLESKFVSKRNRHRHKLGSFVTRITEHHSLIACAVEVIFILFAALELIRSVNAHCNVGRLLVQRGDNCAGVAVKALVCAVVSDIADRFSCDRRDINVSRC